MKEYYVYILRCSDNTYYVGITNNIMQRLSEHKSRKHEYAYTAKRLPVILEYSMQFTDIRVAIEYEKKIKKWSKQKKRALIEGKFAELPIMAKKKRATSRYEK